MTIVSACPDSTDDEFDRSRCDRRLETAADHASRGCWKTRLADGSNAVDRPAMSLLQHGRNHRGRTLRVYASGRCAGSAALRAARRRRGCAQAAQREVDQRGTRLLCVHDRAGLRRVIRPCPAGCTGRRGSPRRRPSPTSWASTARRRGASPMAVHTRWLPRRCCQPDARDRRRPRSMPRSLRRHGRHERRGGRDPGEGRASHRLAARAGRRDADGKRRGSAHRPGRRCSRGSTGRR